MSLVEVLVCITLLGLLLTAAYMLLLPALKYYPPANERSHLEQGGAVVAMRSPGGIEQALARASHVDLGNLLRQLIPHLLLWGIVASLFFLLASRGRIDLTNGAKWNDPVVPLLV